METAHVGNKKLSPNPLRLGSFEYKTDKSIEAAGLEAGDLLFYWNGDRTQHVSIVTSKDSGAVREVHQISDSKWQGLHETEVNLIAGFFVFRCRDRALAAKAASWAKRWVDEFPAPFSPHRYGVAVSHEVKHANDVVEAHRSLFQKFGKFRAIKYAARRNGQLIYPSEKDPRTKGNRGMFCSMFVAVCYQVAGLQDLVESAPPELRVSDKKMTPKDMKTYKKRCEDSVDNVDLGNFEMYLHHLKDTDPYDLDTKNTKGAKQQKGLTYTPSLEYWKAKTCNVERCDWPKLITKGMMVDAKVIMPMGLLVCLMDDPEGWTDEGFLRDKQNFLETKLQKDSRMKAQQARINEGFPRK